MVFIQNFKRNKAESKEVLIRWWSLGNVGFHCRSRSSGTPGLKIHLWSEKASKGSLRSTSYEYRPHLMNMTFDILHACSLPTVP